MCASRYTTYFVPSFPSSVDIFDSFWLRKRKHIRSQSNNITILFVNVKHWSLVFFQIRVKHSPQVGKRSEEGTVIFGEAILVTKIEQPSDGYDNKTSDPSFYRDRRDRGRIEILVSQRHL